MIQVRQGVFETNSSSVHSITMCTRTEFNAWREGKLYLNEGYWHRSTSPYAKKQFVTKDEAMELIKTSTYYQPFNEYEELLGEYLREYEIYDYEHWGHYYESDVNHYTTPGGEEIVAVCYYGHD